MRRFGIGWLAVALVAVGVEADGAITKVRGRVIAADGSPVAGADVATFWGFDDGKPRPFGGVKADAEGKFAIEDDFYGRPGPLMAMNADRTAGGWIAVDPKQVPESAEIKLGPLVRVHGAFSCTELAPKPPGWTNVYMMTEDRAHRLVQCGSDRATFDLKLPAGTYRFFGYGSGDLTQVHKVLELTADKPDVDLGTLDIPASPLGKMYGKPAPALHITDARGIAKDMKLTDLKGKWVVLDFWGYWCGPCVGDSLPGLMQLWDEYPDDRDKFAFLAFHDSRAKDFRELDEKLKPIVASTWGGRELPFPILLDATGETVREYGIHTWPTTILIDPAGNVVRGGEEALRKHLPEIPVARRIPLALDRQVSVGFSMGTRLDKFVEVFGRDVHVPIKLDDAALTSAGIARDALIPLTMNGQVSLRSWLDLGLRPLGLVAVPGPEGLVVTTPRPDAPLAPEPTAIQRRVAARIEGKLAAPTTFDFHDASLAEVASFFEEATGENFVLDPADRRAGRLDPKATVTGRAEGAPLRDGLKGLLGPLGVEVVVRDEVVILARPAAP